MPRPLDGIRVLDLSRVVAGPFAGRMLSDLGADVVKVEPPEGDVTRVWGEKRNTVSGFFNQQNAGKRNVCIDLKTEEGRALCIELASKADILLENFRAGVMERLGLGWSVMQAANPRLIMCSISGFGQTGPESHRPAYAPVIQAESGYVHRQATLDGRPPTDPVLSIADYVAGLHSLVGVLAALELRHTTGQGTYLDLSMVDAMICTDDYMHHAVDGFPMDRLGGQFFQAGDDRWLLVAGEPKFVWKQLSDKADKVDTTPKDAPLADKIANRQRVAVEYFRSFATLEDLKRELERLKLPWGDIRTPEEAIASPTAVAHGAIAQVDDRAGGTRGVVQSPYRYSNAESGVRGGTSHRGEHNAEVLAEWLGRSAADSADLEARRVLRSAVPGA